MEAYLWGVYLTNFLWAHHAEIAMFYQDRFLSSVGPESEIVEIAPGHGGWGVWALDSIRGASLKAFDISPASIQIASSVAKAAGVSSRVEYQERNALDLAQVSAQSADAVICSFLVEHLEDPGQLFAVIHHLLRPGGVAYLTGALTAAQVDHIYEFRFESELVRMAEANGLRVTETFSGNPRRVLRGAQFVPRSMALIMRRRVGKYA
jgi:ubiquinone/menaquinone biosynthesis C-methylase UbiE